MQFSLTPAAMPEGYGEALLPIAAARQWARIDDEDGEEDDLIAALRDAAIDMVEQYGNLKLRTTPGLVASFAGFGERMRPGIGPAATLTVTGIAYTDANGTATTIAGGGWRVDTLGGIAPAVGTSWPSGGRDVRVTFTAGYPVGACPPALVVAAKMFVAQLYINREDAIGGTMTGEIAIGIRALIDRYRMPVL